MYKCIICSTEHNEVWKDKPDEPSAYCAVCLPLKQDSTHEISQITECLFLSGMKPAGSFAGDRLCVHEHGALYSEPHIQVSILTKRPNSGVDRSGAVASIEKLDEAAAIIDSYVKQNKRLLIHCFGGMERSPLTLAWYFVKSGQFKTLDEAYVFLKSKRPVVCDRTFWLPSHV